MAASRVTLGSNTYLQRPPNIIAPTCDHRDFRLPDRVRAQPDPRTDPGRPEGGKGLRTQGRHLSTGRSTARVSPPRRALFEAGKGRFRAVWRFSVPVSRGTASRGPERHGVDQDRDEGPVVEDRCPWRAGSAGCSPHPEGMPDPGRPRRSCRAAIPAPSSQPRHGTRRPERSGAARAGAPPTCPRAFSRCAPCRRRAAAADRDRVSTCASRARNSGEEHGSCNAGDVSRRVESPSPAASGGA